MAEESKKVAQILCKTCGKPYKMYVPQNGGAIKVKCPHCGGTMVINFAKTKPTKDIDGSGGEGMQRGKLTQVRGLLYKNISYPLQMGSNTIGQYDLGMPSSIMIKDDTISRQCANIKMDYDDNRIDYKFCLLRSKNPVLLNGTPVKVGEERYLKFGDILVLGRTTLRFEKA